MTLIFKDSYGNAITRTDLRLVYATPSLGACVTIDYRTYVVTEVDINYDIKEIHVRVK